MNIAHWLTRLGPRATPTTENRTASAWPTRSNASSP